MIFYRRFPMSKLEITPILCRAGQMDNYTWLLTDSESGKTALIDPSEADPIIETCKKLQKHPEYILNTHHHFDHTDANESLKQLYHAQIIGCRADTKRIPGIDIGLDEGDTFELGKSSAQIIRADGHTIGHILWYFPQAKALFTGDTLFNLCVGGLFEGSVEQMFHSLQKIKSLPDDTLFYPGHEYTVHGMGFAQYYSPNNQILKEYIQTALKRKQQGIPVAPVSLKIEKSCNPYLQAATPQALQKLFAL